MKWIIERNMFFANDQMRFVEALTASGAHFSLVDFVPFEHVIVPELGSADFLVAMGSTNFIRTVLKKGWKPGAWHNPDFRFEVWRDRLGAQLLNFDGVVQPFGALDYGGVRFLRPCEDLKAFSGTLVHHDHLESWKGACQQYDIMSEENVLTAYTPIVVAPVKSIHGEYRFFVVDRRVVSGCRYKPSWSIDANDVMIDVAREFAEQVACQWGPADAYVMDVAELLTDFAVIEYNCLNAAGLYVCPVEPIIEGIEALVRSRHY